MESGNPHCIEQQFWLLLESKNHSYSQFMLSVGYEQKENGHG